MARSPRGSRSPAPPARSRVRPDRPRTRPTAAAGARVSFHQLQAALEIGLDPAVDGAQPVGRAAPLLAQAAIDRLGVAPLEPLNHHDQHRALRSFDRSEILPDRRLSVIRHQARPFSAPLPGPGTIGITMWPRPHRSSGFARPRRHGPACLDRPLQVFWPIRDAATASGMRNPRWRAGLSRGRPFIAPWLARSSCGPPDSSASSAVRERP